MKTRLLIIVIGLSVAGIFGIVYSINQYEYNQDLKQLKEWRDIRESILSDIRENKIRNQTVQLDTGLEFTQKLKNARDILYENQDIIPWTGLGVSTSKEAVTISIDDENPEDYRKIIEELVGNDIPIIIKKGGDPFIDSGWITGEDYCREGCDQKELVSMGCDESILAHISKYSNLLDEEFDGSLYLDWMGLPDGVSVEKFEWCVDFIYDKRLPSGESLGVKLDHWENVCSGKVPQCFATFDNGTDVRIQCPDYPWKCGINEFDNYEMLEHKDYPLGVMSPMMSQQRCNDYVISQWQPSFEGREMVEQFLEICIQRGFITPELVERGKIADNFTFGPIQTARTSAGGDIEKTIEILEEMYGEYEN